MFPQKGIDPNHFHFQSLVLDQKDLRQKVQDGQKCSNSLSKQREILIQNDHLHSNKKLLKVDNPHVHQKPNSQAQAGLKQQRIFKEKVQSLIQEKLKMTTKYTSNIDKFIIKNNKQNLGTDLLKKAKKKDQIKLSAFYSEPSSSQQKKNDKLREKENKVQAMNQMNNNEPNFKKLKRSQKETQMTFLIY